MSDWSEAAVAIAGLLMLAWIFGGPLIVIGGCS